MARCRLYLPGPDDARCLDRILGDNRSGDVRLGTDRIICAVDDGDVPTGCLVWRPTALVHEFHVPRTLGQRTVADLLVSESIRLDFNRRHLIRQALFIVDSSNARMLRYLRSVGATEQTGTIFTLELKANNENNGQAGERTEGRGRAVLRAPAGPGDHP